MPLQNSIISYIIFSLGKIKQGKSFLFWGLNNEFPSVAVVGLGKKSKSKDEIELICEEKEAVRTAAAGKKIKQLNCIFKNEFQPVAKL